MEPLTDIIVDIAADAMSDTLQSSKTPKVIKGCFMIFVVICFLLTAVIIISQTDFIPAIIITLVISLGFAFLGIRYIVNLLRKKSENTEADDEKTASAPKSEK